MRVRERPVDMLLRLTVLTATVLLPLVFYLKAYEVFEMGKSLVVRFFGALAVALLLARGCGADGAGAVFASRSLPGVLAFLASCLLSTLHSPLLGATGERLLELGGTIALLWAAESGALAPGKLVAAAIWAQALVATYAAAQYLGYDAIVWTTFGEKRVYATMGNPDFLAAQSSFLIPLMLCAFAGLSERGLRETLEHWRARWEREGPALVGLAAVGRILRSLLLYAGLGCAMPLVAVAALAAASPGLDAGGTDVRMSLFSLAVAGLLCFAGALALRPGRAAARGLLGVALALVFPSLLYTQARGALIGFGAAILVAPLLVARGFYGDALTFGGTLRLMRRWLLGALAALALLVGVLPTGRHMIERFREFRDPVKSSTMQIRLFYWYSGWLMGIGEPTRPGETGVLLPIGAGLGTFHLSGARAQGHAMQIWNVKWPRAAEQVSPHLELYAHNDYVHLFAELGPLGLGIYLWIAVVLARSGLVALLRAPPHALLARWGLIGLLSATASWYANSLFNFPLKVVANAHLFFAVVAPVLLAASPLRVWRIPLPRNPAPAAAALLLALWTGERGAAKLAASHNLKIGHQMTQQNAPAQAAVFFGRAAALGPIHTDGILVHYYRGKAMQAAAGAATDPAAAASLYRDAEASYTRALAVFSNFPEGYQARGMLRLTVAYGARAQADPAVVAALDGALADLRESLYLNPKDPLTCFSLGTALRLRREPAPAIPLFRDAITFSLDRIPDAHLGLALSLAETGKIREARAVLESAAARFGTSMPAGTRAALAALRAGRVPPRS